MLKSVSTRTQQQLDGYQEAATENGDTVVIDFVGSRWCWYDGGKVKTSPWTWFSQFILVLDQLVGHSAGRKLLILSTFPEDTKQKTLQVERLNS